jgi:tripartite-type tricarboxylate transporter receptor subunit TctC
MISRRLWFFAICLLTVGIEAAAQDYPTKPLRVVVPWPAGGFVDAVARVLGEKLTTELGQPVIVENRTGAAGNIGVEVVAKAPPDGYTLLLTNSSVTMGVALRPKVSVDVRTELVPIVLAGFAPSLLVVHPSLGVKSVEDLVALAKAKPSTLTYASSGQGTPAHLAAEMFRVLADINVIHVPYKGAAPMLQDQIAGLVSFSFSVAPAGLPQVKAGRVHALAITSATRSPLVPDIPTMQEAGIKGYEASQWVGFFAPRGTPKPIVEKLAASLNKVLGNEEVKASLSRQGVDIERSSTPASFESFINADVRKWQGVVRDAKLVAE